MTIVTQIWISDLDQHPAKLLECSERFANEESHHLGGSPEPLIKDKYFSIFLFFIIVLTLSLEVLSMCFSIFTRYLASEGQ